MVALAQLRADEARDRCPLCGMPKRICQDPANQFLVDVDFARCHVMTAIRARQDEWVNGAKRLGTDPYHPDALVFGASLP